MNLVRKILNIKLFRSKTLDKNKYVKITALALIGLIFLLLSLLFILQESSSSLEELIALRGLRILINVLFYSVFGILLFLIDIIFYFREKKKS